MTEPGELEHLYAQVCLFFSNSDITIQRALNGLTRSERYALLKTINLNGETGIIFGCSNEIIEEWRDCKIDLSTEETVNFVKFVTKYYGEEAVCSLLRYQTIPFIVKNKEI